MAVLPAHQQPATPRCPGHRHHQGRRRADQQLTVASSPLGLTPAATSFGERQGIGCVRPFIFQLPAISGRLERAIEFPILFGRSDRGAYLAAAAFAVKGRRLPERMTAGGRRPVAPSKTLSEPVNQFRKYARFIVLLHPLRHADHQLRPAGVSATC